MALFLARKSRGLTKDITISGADGAITPGGNDKIRAIIRGIDVDYLTVTSDAATANGSSFTKNYPVDGKNRLRLDASDLTFAPGCYTIIFDYFDNADAAEWKTIDRQTFVLEA